MKTPLYPAIATLLFSVSSLCAATHYVSLGSKHPTAPYTNWVTAATNIQDAVNAAAGGDVVLVTNGVYRGGLGVSNALALVSVNGPQVTIINGYGTNSCVSLGNGASLTGFTATNGMRTVITVTTANIVTNNPPGHVPRGVMGAWWGPQTPLSPTV